MAALPDADEMSFEHKKILRMYGDYLLNHVLPSEKLLLIATAKGLLDTQSADDIRHIPDNHSKVAKLMRAVKTSGPEGFRTFCDVLEESNQDIAAQLLRSAELSSIIKGRIVDEVPKSLRTRLERNIARVDILEHDLSKTRDLQRDDQRRLQETLKSHEKKRDREMAELKRRMGTMEGHISSLTRENTDHKRQILTLEWALRSVSESVTGSPIVLHTHGDSQVVPEFLRQSGVDFSKPSEDRTQGAKDKQSSAFLTQNDQRFTQDKQNHFMFHEDSH